MLDFSWLFFRNGQSQDTILKFCMDVVLGQSIADIEGTAHAACITFSADILTIFLVFVFIKTFCSLDAQIAVVQLDADFIFLESRQVDVQFIILALSIGEC